MDSLFLDRRDQSRFGLLGRNIARQGSQGKNQGQLLFSIQGGGNFIFTNQLQHLGIIMYAQRSPRYQRPITFSPDGQFVGVCAYDFAAICHVGLGQLVVKFIPLKRMMGDSAGKVHGLSISADNRIVAVRFDESVNFWEITTPIPKLIRTYKATWSALSSFLFISPDEMIRIRQTHPHMVDLFDLATRDSIGTFLKSFVKQDPHDGPLQADLPLDQPLIRIRSGSPTPITRNAEQATPENVELWRGNNMALSYSSGTETRRWDAIDKSMKAFEVNVQALIYSPDREYILLQLERGDDFQVWDKTLNRKIAAYEQLAYMGVVPQTC
ncbi:hypothetical protein FANTH_14377 [Fusarium anthophilum]|uniref:Uncharacterized protein n=1 Tax=Fusarium anthophilum TaxID=48485 RepID=A0A8H5DMF6_9HYPO|nr:hypothetical protein FANTH_14377 [Fusarium anthophilum]